MKPIVYKQKSQGFPDLYRKFLHRSSDTKDNYSSGHKGDSDTIQSRNDESVGARSECVKVIVNPQPPVDEVIQCYAERTIF